MEVIYLTKFLVNSVYLTDFLKVNKSNSKNENNNNKEARKSFLISCMTDNSENET